MPEAMKYGTESFEVHLPAEQIAAEVEANHVDLPQRTVAEHIRYALDHPIDSAPLRELVKPGETVCIIISDVTRRRQSPVGTTPPTATSASRRASRPWRSWSRPASGMRTC